MIGSSGIATANGEPAPGEVEWEYELGDSVSSSPTVVDGIVYIGSYDGHVYALNATTGDEEWSYDAGTIVWSAPQVVDGTVFVGTRQNIRQEEDGVVFGDGHVIAIDADTGEELWTYTVDSGFRSSPTVLDGTVYIGSYYQIPREQSEGGALRAIDTESGEEDWVFEAPYPIQSSPSIVDDTVYVQSGALLYQEGSLVHAIDTDSGEQEWEFDVGYHASTSPTIADGTVYAIGDEIYAIDADEGREEWTFVYWASVPVAHRFKTTPTVADGILFVGGQDGLVAIDTDEVEELWSFETETDVTASPTVAGGLVYCPVPLNYRPSGHEAVRLDSEVYALDAVTGDIEWKHETEQTDFQTAPTIVNGTLYIGCHDNNVFDSHVYALDAGVDGSSVDSRVELGTLGHHQSWAKRAGTTHGLGLSTNQETLVRAAGAFGSLGAGGYLLNRSRTDQ